MTKPNPVARLLAASVWSLPMLVTAQPPPAAPPPPDSLFYVTSAANRAEEVRPVEVER